MKKVFTLLCLMVVLVGYGRTVTPEEAAEAASEILGMPRKAVAFRTPKLGTKSDAKPYYVVERPDAGGYVYVSGDDRLPKIIGYVPEGSFVAENIPLQLQAILDRIETSEIEADRPQHPSWKKKLAVETAGEVLWETAQWGQAAPYNAECPIVDGQRAVTGCVATAMAIVMKHNKWPEGYNWDAMPMSGVTEANAGDIPAVMAAAGKAVFMEYGPFESGSEMNWTGHKLQEVFHYSPECQFITSTNFTQEQWHDMLRKNLTDGHPVIYNGIGSGGNHAFIIDGYNDDFYHVNWGWDGGSNGYFALDALNTGTMDFSDAAGMVINIEPDRSGEVYSRAFVDYGYFWATKGYAEYMNLSVENVVKDQPFYLFHEMITLPVAFKGHVGVGLVGADNKIKEVLKKTFFDYSDLDLSLQGNFPAVGPSLAFEQMVVTTDIKPDDRLQLITMESDDADFKLVLGTMEAPSYVGVANNTPRTSDITFNIAEGLHVVFNPYTQAEMTLPEGKSVVKCFNGADVFMTVNSDDNLSDNSTIILTSKGPHLYGDETKIGNDIYYNWRIIGNYEVDVKRIELTEENITIQTAGTLSQLLPTDKAQCISKMTISGKMNALDFWYIRDNCPCLKELDLSDVTVEAVEASDSRFMDTVLPVQPANAIPEWALTQLVNLRDLTLPKSIEAIESNSLMSLNLKGIVIPAGVKSIGLNVFFSNSMLEAVCMLNPEPVVIKDCIFTSTLCPAEGTLYVPEGSVAKYKETPVWQDFKVIEVGSVSSFKESEITVDGLKYSCSAVKATVIGYDENPENVIIPDVVKFGDNQVPVTGIAEAAFRGCTSMKSIKMTDNIILMGDFAFDDCYNLEKVELSKSLSKIAFAAFTNCSSLKECALHSGIKVLGTSSFYGTGFDTFTIPAWVAPENNASPFGNNQYLSAFTVEEGNEYFEAREGVLYRKLNEGVALEILPASFEGTFQFPDDCASTMNSAITSVQGLTEIIFNANQSVIESGAVVGCDNLEHVTLPNSAFISPNAIEYCIALKSVTIPGKQKLSDNVFNNCPAEYVYLTSEENVGHLSQIFDRTDGLTAVTPSLVPNFECDTDTKVLVPGATSSNYKNAVELWKYEFFEDIDAFSIEPTLEDVSISRVLINGTEVASTSTHYDFDASKPLTVEVHFTVHNRQPMVTSYHSEFNAAMPRTKNSGIIALPGSESRKRLYNIMGIPADDSATGVLIETDTTGNSRKIFIR